MPPQCMKARPGCAGSARIGRRRAQETALDQPDGVASGSAVVMAARLPHHMETRRHSAPRRAALAYQIGAAAPTGGEDQPVIMRHRQCATMIEQAANQAYAQGVSMCARVGDRDSVRSPGVEPHAAAWIAGSATRTRATIASLSRYR